MTGKETSFMKDTAEKCDQGDFYISNNILSWERETTGWSFTFTSVVSENLFQKTKMDLGNEKLHVWSGTSDHNSIVKSLQTQKQ